MELLVLGGDGSDVLIQPIRPDTLTLEHVLEFGYFDGPFPLNIFTDFPARLTEVALVVG